MNPKQRAFVREYQVDHNGAQAAQRAGYSPNGAKVAASRLLTNVNVQEALRAAEAKNEKCSERNQASVIERLWEIADFARPGPTFNATAATKALELIGKHLGMWPSYGKQAPTSNEAEVPFSERVKLYAMRDRLAEAGNVAPFSRDGDGQ